MNIILKKLQISASIGASNHGLNLFIKGKNQRSIYNAIASSDKLSIDIQGPVFRYLPSGIGTIANMFLPYSIEPHMRKIKQEGSYANCQIELGQYKLSAATLMKTLDDVIKAGDPYFYVELIKNHQDTYCVFPTKCSLIKQSINSEGKSDIIYTTNDIPEFKIKSNAYGYCRWLFFGFLYMLTIWAMIGNFDYFDKKIPVSYFSKSRANQSSFIDFIPPFPKNKTQAYLLVKGVYNEQYQQMEKIHNNEEMQLILQKAAELTNRKSVTGEELKGVEKTIWELEQKKGLVQRVLGFFTFVNLIWIVSIVGITITVGPFIYLILKPLRAFFEVVLVNLFKKVIIPTVEFLHNIGAFEIFSYLLCLFLVLEGMRLNPEYGFFITLTGIVLQIPAFLYSTLLHSNKIRAPKNEENLIHLILHWILLCWIPFVSFFYFNSSISQVFYYSSTLLGYSSILVIYWLIAYLYNCFGICTLLDLDRYDFLWRVYFLINLYSYQETICSFFGLLIFFILKVSGIPYQFLYPFQSPINIFGSFSMFFGLLISSSSWYNRRDHWKAQCFMVIVIILSISVGFVFGIDGMINTAIIFFTLFILEIYTEIHFDNRWNPWCYFFIFSILLWRAALYLHKNPKYVVSLFNAFE